MKQPSGADASKLIDKRIQELGDWRGEMLARLRALILGADKRIIEEWKWDGPVWSCDGVICTGEVYKSVVKLTFIKGAQVSDPKGIFNASLQGNARRAIDFREGEAPDARGFQALIKRAAGLNTKLRKTVAKQ